MRRQVAGAHRGGGQQRLQFKIERAMTLVGLVLQIRQRRGIAVGARGLGDQRLGRDGPGADRGGEALRQERPERLVFPGLQVARRPVVEQAKSGDMRLGLGHANAAAERVARADPNAKLELVIEPSAGTELRRRSLREFRLAKGRMTGAPLGMMDEARP